MNRRGLGPALGRVVGPLLGVPAVAVTVARIAGTHHRPAVVLQSMAPLALPAYGVALVRLGVVSARTRSPAALAGTLVAALGVGLHAWWEAPMFVGRPPAAGSGTRMTVMTANIELGRGDAAALARAVHDRGVGLLAVQEITPEALRRIEATDIAADLPYRAGRADRATGGTVLFSRTPLTDVREYPTLMGTWAATTAGWRVMAVHPAFPLSPRWAQDQEILRRAALTERPDLVLGDFNATLDHRPMRQLLDTGLRDAAELTNAGWQPTWPANGFRGLPVPAWVAIDHVLVGPRLTALWTSTETIPDTDHKALVAGVAKRR